MTRMIVGVIGLLALGGCAGAHIKPAPVCDGKHRRPANLYGTVMPTLPVPLPASQGGGQSQASPATGSKPPAAPPAQTPPATPTPEITPSATPGPGAMLTPPPVPWTPRRDVALATSSC